MLVITRILVSQFLGWVPQKNKDCNGVREPVPTTGSPVTRALWKNTKIRQGPKDDPTKK